ncbi:hypothetical protein [Zhongshania marina]|uniref:Uncharacterized protein n=1 Tax=Zhongshania marina TaxID=2304603 RepID=A0A2S4HAI4_9GAMM|nr:hypothetical protein [Marortus luteolus]POP50992.1 hypothetical protein C0068_19355 [Marortus luteolus]
MKFIGIAIVVIVVAVVAILVNGAIANVEDSSPGGFDNPDGKWSDAIRHPKRHQVIIWCLGGLTIAWLVYMWVSNANI